MTSTGPRTRTRKPVATTIEQPVQDEQTRAPGSPPDAQNPTVLQRRAYQGVDTDTIVVRLFIGDSVDGVRYYDESLPVSLVRAILDPTVDNFFIPIEGSGRMKPRIVVSHWLHTSTIRELFIMSDAVDFFPVQEEPRSE